MTRAAALSFFIAAMPALCLPRAFRDGVNRIDCINIEARHTLVNAARNYDWARVGVKCADTGFGQGLCNRRLCPAVTTEDVRPLLNTLQRTPLRLATAPERDMPRCLGFRRTPQSLKFAPVHGVARGTGLSAWISSRRCQNRGSRIWDRPFEKARL